ncbi:MAG: YdcF family protein [Firmicutes bacterium]|nr:YdcF family protein [Bacillota bacterium]
MNRNIKAITEFIFVEDIPQKSDVIMVVGGSYPEAAEIAADLWKQGYADTIIIGGGVSKKTGKFLGSRSKREIYSKDYANECEFYTDVLLKNGVDKRAVYGENKSSFTKENAFYARRLADKYCLNIHKAILICKAFHARRCLLFYQTAFPCVEFFVKTFDGFGINKDNWYLSEYGIQRVLGELKRCGEQINADEFIK